MTQYVQVTGLKKGASRYPRYDAAALGFEHYWYPVMRTRQLKPNKPVALTLFGEKTNLHSVWDSGLIESEKLSFSELAAFIDHPTLAELRTWQSSPPADWVRESKAVRDRVYKIGDGKLGYQYAFDNMPLIKRRLLQAGVRLAGLLNSIFAQPAPSIPDR